MTKDVATGTGVEATARQAYDANFNVAFTSDVMTILSCFSQTVIP
jgi:hypothetical protein